jgi:DNA-binding CsgD family transcriptional regulator
MPPRVAILDAAFEPEWVDEALGPIDRVFCDAAERAVAESRASIDVDCGRQQFVVRVAQLFGGDVLRYAVSVSVRSERRPLLDALDNFGLTAREIDVLAMIVDGATNAEIATALSIVPGTVQDHVRRLSKKIGARRRGDMLAKVFGFTSPGDIGLRPAQDLGNHS